MSDARRAQGRAVPSGRLSRLARMGSMTAGVAGNMALGGVAQLGRGQRPNWRDLMLTPGNVNRVARQLSQMRGAAMKIGQLVSMDTGDVLPPELAQIMARVREDADFMPPAQLKKVLAANWHAGWLRDFAQFDVRPIAAASIGQVHRARLKDGRTLAIKVQYPGVARSIDSDVANVGALIRMSGLLPQGFALDPYLADAAAQLHEETDYLREAEQMRRFGSLLQGTAGFVVPQVHDALSTGQILAMDFIDSVPIEEVAHLDQADRDDVAARLMRLTLRELFEFGLMQTDPNFANYRFEPHSKDIVLLDFGATRPLDPQVVAQYGALMRAGLADDGPAMEAAARAIGFITADVAPRHVTRIMAMMRHVFEALRVPLFDFTDETLSRRMQAEGEALARDGFIPPVVPIDVLFAQRKFGGMFLLGARLRARLPLAQMCAEAIGG
ncbi:AarF/ABC1/UbiB kinase family protein [Sulfitobacter sp. S190]|uniref:ABC1 kinase family protein n=1 Tax=Sulfitobacter sp. S190 TaxID=2867022 RepID=UPI0021A328FC|nr:AarF/ABC1/UbiB kinase family protein [Sulfitobacter sp. S190]UWR23347.1 AarF/ABC1/UbiB kinase family protein [Sulfitobacter sp. S190]